MHNHQEKAKIKPAATPPSRIPLRRAGGRKTFYCANAEIEINSDNDNSVIKVYTQYTPTDIFNKDSGPFRISQEATEEKVNFGPKLDFISKRHGLKEDNLIRCI